LVLECVILHSRLTLAEDAMNRLLRPLLAGGLIAAAVVPFVSACADNDSSLFIAGVMVVKPPTCTVTADPTQPQQFSGILDVGVTSSYQAVLLVGNQLTARGAKQELNTETTRVVLDRAEVSLRFPSGQQISCGNENCSEFSVYGTGFATSTTGEDPGWGLFNAELIPPLVAQTLSAQIGSSTDLLSVVATVKVSGHTLGGKRLDSAPLSYSIDVCNGCWCVPTGGVCLRGQDAQCRLDPASPRADAGAGAP
jgi:hypothetical protein